MQAKCLGLECRSCGKVIPQSPVQKCPDCGSPLRVVFEPESLNKAIKEVLSKPANGGMLEQWFDILPINSEEEISFVTLGERETALLKSHKIGPSLGIKELYFKIEQGPTLSLKDRGTVLCVLKAREYGADTVCLASSGNNASSVSAYGTRAGLKPVVFVQKQVSPSKIAKMTAYGGNVVSVNGGMAEASKVCDEMVCRHGWFQCGGPNPYRICGKRIFAYELVRQLGQTPDTLLIPTGGGAGFIAAWDAYREMRDAGIISRLPRLVCVQLTACDPIARAWRVGQTEVKPVEKKKSLSDAIMNANPYWGKFCLQALKESNGTVITVTDEDFVSAIRKLGREEGIFVEPAAAATVAALPHLLKIPEFADPGLTVCNLTGHGLNSPTVAIDKEEHPMQADATAEAVEEAIKQLGIGK